MSCSHMNMHNDASIYDIMDGHAKMCCFSAHQMSKTRVGCHYYGHHTVGV